MAVSRKSVLCSVSILAGFAVALMLALNYQPFATMRRIGLPIRPAFRDVAYYGMEGEPTTVILVRVSDADIARLEKGFQWRAPKRAVWYDEIPWYRDLVHYREFAALIPPRYKDSNVPSTVQATDGAFKGGSWTAILAEELAFAVDRCGVERGGKA